MDFTCLRNCVLCLHFSPVITRGALWASGGGGTLSWATHTSLCSSLWLRERSPWAQKRSLSRGKWANPALLLPPTSTSSCLWYHLPVDPLIQQPRPGSSLTPLWCFADYPIPLGLLPFLGYHSQIFVLHWVPFVIIILEFLTDLSSV